MRTLLLAAALSLSCAAAPAWAADATVLHDGPLQADGATDSLVQVVVPDVTADDALRIGAQGAEVVAHETGPQGTVFLTLRPGRVHEPGAVEVSIRGRGDTDVKADVTVPVAPAPTGELSLAFDPPVLDAPQGVLITVKPTGAAHLPAEWRSIEVAASVGEVTEVERSSDGGWTALWAPPEDLPTPAGVLFTALDRTAPERLVGAATLPIRGSVSRRFDAVPGATASLTIEGRTVGPVQAAEDGTVAFDLVLDPGDVLGTLTVTDRDGERRSHTVDLENPASPNLAFAPWGGETGVPAGEPVSLWLKAAEAGGGGRDRVPDLIVESERPAEVRHPGGGWHEVILAAPERPGPFTVRAGLGTATTTLDLVAVDRWPTLALGAAPVGQVDETARITASWDAGRGDRPRDALVLHPVGTSWASEPLWTEQGLVADLALGRSSRGVVTAAVPFTPTGLPPVRVRLWPGQPWAGPGDPVPVFVVVEDPLGLPVPDQTVTFAGSGRLQGLPEQVDTGPEGWGRVVVSRVEGDPVEPLVIAADSGPLTGATVLWPHAAALGTVRDAAARERWGLSLPTLVVRRLADPLGTAVVPPPPGPVSRVEAVAEVAAPPEPVRPGRRLPPRLQGPSWKVRFGLIDDGLRSRQRSDDPERAPQDAAFRQGLPLGAFGLFGSAEAWFTERWGAELSGRWATYRLVVEGQGFRDSIGAWWAAVRHRQPFATTDTAVLSWEVTVGVHRTDALALAYDTQGNFILPRDLPLTGLRVGGGVHGDWDVFVGRLELAETFGPGPVDTHLGALLDVPLALEVSGMAVLLTAGLSFDFRHLGRTLDNGAEVRIRDTQLIPFVGVGFGGSRGWTGRGGSE